MQEKDYINIINNSFLHTFSEAFLIDVIQDKVYKYVIESNQIREEKIVPFMTFVDDANNCIRTEDLSNYFNSISIQKLENSKIQGNNNIFCKYYKKNNTNIYQPYISIIQLIDFNGNKSILILSANADELKQEVAKIPIQSSIQSDELNIKLKNMSDDVSNAILKIFNTIDTQQKDSASNYIRIVLEQLIRDFPEFNKSLEKNLISQVNKKNNVIMIIDDDSMTRNLLKKAFEDEYKIVEMENGKVAIEYLQQNISNHNLDTVDNITGIFLDIAMPVLDGFAVLDYLKQNNALSKLPVIIISAAEDKETRKKAYQYSIADMLEKPFNLDVIKHRTKNFINLYKTSKALNELVIYKNKELSNIIEILTNPFLPNVSRIKEYIRILIEQLAKEYNLEGKSYSTIFVQMAILATEYDNLLAKSEAKNHNDIAATIISSENIKYSNIVIGTFKKVMEKFTTVK